MNKLTQADRVSVSLGQKIGLPNYSSKDIHFSLSTDVREGETVEQAKARAMETVTAWIRAALDKSGE